MIHRLSETDQNELKLDSYHMYIHHTSCIRCGSGEQYSELQEVWIHPTKTRTTGLKVMRPAAEPLKPVNMTFHHKPTRQIPICSDCVHTYQTPAKGAPDNVASMAEWAETLKRKYEPSTPTIKIARASQPSAGTKSEIIPPTADQL